MSPKSAIRRLLKSQLRLHVLRALASERADSESWGSVIEVEEGISEDAWSSWVKIRAAHEEYEAVAREGLQEAAESAASAFAGVADPVWLMQRIQSFVEGFQTAQLMGEGPCTSATS